MVSPQGAAMSYQQTLERTYREAHQRLIGPTKKQFFRIIEKPVEPVPEPPPPPPKIELSPLYTGPLPTMRSLLKRVSEVSGIPVRDIRGRYRDRRICRAREIFYYLARTL